MTARRRIAALLAPLLAALLVTPCVAAADADLIPIDTLLTPPAFWSPLISPDGEMISYVAIHNDAPNLFVAQSDDLSTARPVTAATGQGVTTSNVAGSVTYRWTADSKRLLYRQDESGDERWHLLSVEISSGSVTDLTPIAGIQARLVAASALWPDHVLVSIDGADHGGLYRVNLQSGERELVTSRGPYIGFFADNALSPRVAVAPADDGGFRIDRWTRGHWEPFFRLAQEDSSALIRAVEQRAWSFSPDNRALRIYDSRGRDTWAMVEIDLQSGDQQVLAQHENVDLDLVQWHPDTGDLQAYSANRAKRDWIVVDSDLAADFRTLAGVDSGQFLITGRSRDLARWLVLYIRSNGSPELYRYDRPSGQVRHLATQMPGLDDLSLPESRPYITQSRDGLTLVSYLLLPSGTDMDGDGLPASPLPMVVYVHGGPNDERAVMRYHPYLQWLANRGYAVLDVNYRGSPGFGKHFLNAQNLEWGNKMHLDIVDQVERAVADGIADGERVGIFGGSFGGYEVLVAMTKTPERFACGVDLAGPSDLERFIPIWWENFIPASNMAYKSIVLGDPDTAAGRAALRRSSPLHFAHQAKNPILVVQGDLDSRVPTEQADLIVEALQKVGAPITYVLFPDEGHGVVRPANSRLFYALVEAFFGDCLGGRFKPVTHQVNGTSAQVRVGADRIPGLADALSGHAESP